MLFVSYIIVVKGMYLNLEDKYIINFHIGMMLFFHFKCVNIFSQIWHLSKYNSTFEYKQKKTF